MDAHVKLKLIFNMDNQIISFENPSDHNVRSTMLLSTKHEINRITVHLHETDETPYYNETDSHSTTDEITDAEIDSKLPEVDDITGLQKERLRDLIYKYREIFRKAPGRFKSYEYRFEFQDEKPYFFKKVLSPIPYP